MKRTLILILLALSVRSAAAWQPVWQYPDAGQETTYWLGFFHHSAGSNWMIHGLRDGYSVSWSGGVDEGEGLRDLLHETTRQYYTIDVGYSGHNGDGTTDLRHFYPRFRYEVGHADGRVWGSDDVWIPFEDSMIRFYCPVGPSIELISSTNPDGFVQGDELDIVMIKPDFFNSQLESTDTVTDGSQANNGQGLVLSGTPWSDSGQQHSNLEWLNPEAVADYTMVSDLDDAEMYRAQDEYWPDRAAWNRDLAHVKVALRGLLNIFHEHPDRLFLLVLPPRLTGLSAAERANMRELSRWCDRDFLSQYDPTGTDTFQDYTDSAGKVNVAVFDYFNALVYTGEDPLLDADYGWGPDAFNLHSDPQRLPGTEPDSYYNLPKPADWIGRARGAADHPGASEDRHVVDVFAGNNGYAHWINQAVARWQTPVGGEIDDIRITAVLPQPQLAWTAPSAEELTYRVYRSPEAYVPIEHYELAGSFVSSSGVPEWTDVEVDPLLTPQMYYRVTWER